MKKLLPLLCLVLFSCKPKNKTIKSHSDNSSEIETETNEVKEPEVEQPTEIILPQIENYICYKGDENSSLNISIGFDKDGNAVKVRYKGQKESMILKFLDEEMENSGAHPNIITQYSEIADGKENGVYELVHSGIWDYATYTRGKDGKVFKFTIDHDLTVINDAYRTTPCFE